MADNNISGHFRILPAYPVKPPQPADREREHEKHDQRRPTANNDDDGEADDKPVIDEYV